MPRTTAVPSAAIAPTAEGGLGSTAEGGKAKLCWKMSGWKDTAELEPWASWAEPEDTRVKKSQTVFGSLNAAGQHGVASPTVGAGCPHSVALLCPCSAVADVKEPQGFAEHPKAAASCRDAQLAPRRGQSCGGTRGAEPCEAAPGKTHQLLHLKCVCLCSAFAFYVLPEGCRGQIQVIWNNSEGNDEGS